LASLEGFRRALVSEMVGLQWKGGPGSGLPAYSLRLKGIYIIN